jgi:hypothetical protein
LARTLGKWRPRPGDEPILRGELASLVALRAGTVVVDLTGVTFLDCSCLGVLADARQAQPTGLRILGATGHVALTQRLRRTPSTSETAEHLALTHDDGNQVMTAAAGHAPTSLARPVGAASSTPMAELLAQRITIRSGWSSGRRSFNMSAPLAGV